jgi:hypothetical protein
MTSDMLGEVFEGKLKQTPSRVSRLCRTSTDLFHAVLCDHSAHVIHAEDRVPKISIVLLREEIIESDFSDTFAAAHASICLFLTWFIF